jgi:hypothetical protein
MGKVTLRGSAEEIGIVMVIAMWGGSGPFRKRVHILSTQHVHQIFPERPFSFLLVCPLPLLLICHEKMNYLRKSFVRRRNFIEIL